VAVHANVAQRSPCAGHHDRHRTVHAAVTTSPARVGRAGSSDSARYGISLSWRVRWRVVSILLKCSKR
jgi:hypothetical protein